jgi:hypothetical protein
MNERFNGIGWVVRQRALYVAILLWLLLSGVGFLFSRHTPRFRGLVAGSSEYLVLVVLMFGLVVRLTRKRPVIDLGQRAPKCCIARRETLAIWAYAAVVMVAGRLIGQHLFGEGIALHLNGSLVGATRVQSPIEVYTWAAYNGILLALIPHVVFRMRGCSNEQLNFEIGKPEERYAGDRGSACLQRRVGYDGAKYLSAHAASAACWWADVILAAFVRDGSADHDSYLLDLDAEILQAVFAADGLSAGGSELSDDAYF